MTTRVEVKHDGKTLAFECAESETFQTFVERVREGFGTQSTSASRATFLSAGGARVPGDDVAFDFGALLRKNSRRGRLKMMMVVASAGGGRGDVAGGASRRRGGAGGAGGEIRERRGEKRGERVVVVVDRGAENGVGVDGDRGHAKRGGDGDG